MSEPFNSQRGLIIVRTTITGPAGSGNLRLALDTGATGTMVNVALLVALGYDPTLLPGRIEVTTGSGVEYVPMIAVERLEALGQTRANMRIIAHTLPPSAGIDGLLGLDFLRGQVLTIDFRQSMLDLG